MQAIKEGASEYQQFYLPDLQERIAKNVKAEKDRQDEQLKKIKADVDAGHNRPINAPKQADNGSESEEDP